MENLAAIIATNIGKIITPIKVSFGLSLVDFIHFCPSDLLSLKRKAILNKDR
jgi:hypothetical protein